MYHGGTNFDLKSGSNMAEKIFRPMLTSYDYDAPINEAGDLTEKFFAIKSIITKVSDLKQRDLCVVSFY